MLLILDIADVRASEAPLVKFGPDSWDPKDDALWCNTKVRVCVCGGGGCSIVAALSVDTNS